MPAATTTQSARARSGSAAAEAMEAGDADVLVEDDARAEQLGPDPGLVQYGPVGRAGREHDGEPCRLR